MIVFLQIESEVAPKHHEDRQLPVKGQQGANQSGVEPGSCVGPIGSPIVVPDLSKSSPVKDSAQAAGKSAGPAT
jgi:hypothetical protein